MQVDSRWVVAEQLRKAAALAEDQDLIPSIYMVAHNLL